MPSYHSPAHREFSLMDITLGPIDHVGFGVRELGAAAHRLRQLGFTLTPFAEHTKRAPDGRLQPAGSGQHSVMFERDYIELLGITDPNAQHILAPRIARYVGMHHLLFNVESAELASIKLRARGVAAEDAKEWERPVTHGNLTRTARFSYFAVPPETTPEGLVGFVQHFTPDVIRPAGCMEHGNGAIGLAGVVICANDTAAVVRRYERYLEQPAIRAGDGFVLSMAKDQELCIVSPATLTSMFGELDQPSSQYIAACVVRVRNLDHARQVVSSAGVIPREWAEGFWVEGGRAVGGVIAFAG